MLFSDVHALDELLAPELHFTNHFGQVIGKADDLAFHQSGALRLIELEPSEQHWQLHPGFAVVSVLMHLLGSYQGRPISQYIRYTRVWAISAIGALQVIAGHASEIAPVAREDPAAQPSETAPLRVTGRVVWGGLPVPGARVVLKAPGNFCELPILAEVAVGADGWFVIENLPAGRWTVYAIAPSDDYWEWTGHTLTVGAGRAPEVLGLELSKKMQLLAPEVGTTVDTTSPVLRWDSFPGATHYHVDVFDDESHEAVMRADTPDTSIVVTPQLAPGGRYQWSVSAYSAAQQSIAYFSSWLFMVQP